MKRGVWVLEKLFGTPPSPPPPDVPPVEPDIRGATTIRQQLEKHRNVQACADCHAKIDPLGFVLEAYDPIGKFRSAYASGAAIDTTGEYRGQRFSSPNDIRAYLVQHPDLLAHNLADRLVTYALGRPLGFADQPALRRLQSDWKAKGYALREIIYLITTSELMRQPPGKPATLRLTTPRSAWEQLPGAVAGQPVEDLINRCIAGLAMRINRQRHVIIGTGGVFTAADAYRKLRLGSSLVQIYTALIYEGPGVIAHINQGLRSLLLKDGFKNVSEAIGADLQQA